MFDSNDFDRFDPQNEEKKDEQRSAEQGGGAEPRWYGVSYTAEGYSTGTPSTPKGKKKKIIAVAALCLVACLVISSLSVFGGLLLGKRLFADDNVGGVEHSGGPNNLQSPSGTIYLVENADGYDYAAVTLQKNNGAGLADSQNGSAGNAPMTLIRAVDTVIDSVVEIMTTTMGYGSMSAGAGSGVIIHADGIIVTNNHVISGCDTVYVRLTNGNTYEAYVRGVDEERDIAILKISPKETLCIAKLGYSGALAVGEQVFAIGNPLGQLGGTVTDGIISALERSVTVEGTEMRLVQTNAAINAGNSGGGLFNMAGELVGVVNAKYAASGVEGLGFAIPIDSAMESIEKLLRYGYIPGIPSLGVSLQEGTTWPFGTYVVYVSDAGESTKLQKNDIIRAINGRSVSTMAEVKQILRTLSVGDTVELTVSRNNSTQTISLVLVQYIPEIKAGK